MKHRCNQLEPCIAGQPRPRTRPLHAPLPVITPGMRLHLACTCPMSPVAPTSASFLASMHAHWLQPDSCRQQPVGGQWAQLCIFSSYQRTCCCFVSDDIWGSSGRYRMVSPCTAAFLVKSWDARNACKHSGAVLPPLSAPVGRGADGADAMA
ncbi:hypothetical protein COO60DRAFT_363420 [Scenedesmus sp. NREL 46B-D3]|nr:hypothetical protein COO60DRAFT_363420 [Scenedesmus sp. NREL 46B-D3]